MSEAEQRTSGANKSNKNEPGKDGPDNEDARGPSLKLLYSLIAMALAAAIAIAALIVLPFYRRR